MNKEQIGILKKYVSLARKLGKLPSVREIRKFICSSDKLYNHFESLPKLKAIALHEHPELVDLDTPATLTTGDVEAYRIDLERKKTKKDNAKLVTDVSTLEYIARFAEHVFKGRVEGNKSRRTTAHMHRTHTLVLSDLHFGADIKGDETGVEDFGRIEEARRFAAVIKEASLYKAQYREKTHLEILILGDIIENQLHDPRTGDVLAIQCCRAIHLLVQGIAYLANCYPTVTVRFATGNHGQIGRAHV